MSKAKIGVIGAGWWATEFHIPDLKKRDDVELVSVCKLEQDQLDFVKNKFGFNFFPIYLNFKIIKKKRACLKI